MERSRRGGIEQTATSRIPSNHAIVIALAGTLRPVHALFNIVTGDAVASFEADIKPLFREDDRLEMQFAFDLWSHADVKDEAQNILERLEDGSMPCDEPWAEAQVQTFRDWIAAGFQP
jgi:hypothetical protein